MTETKIKDPKQKQILAIKLRSIESALHLTAKELARICGVSDNTIYRLEGRVKSDAAIEVRTIEGICNKLGVDIDWMMDFSTPADPDADPAADDSIDPVSPVWTKEAEAQIAAGKIAAAVEKQDDIAERVKQVRSELGLSQTDFADLVGIGRANLASIEIGRNRLTEGMAKKIENACEHGGAEWLLTGEERNKDYPLNEPMMEWLMEHPDERERIWKKMRK